MEHNIQLPCSVDPHSASALLTLHGLLFVKVLPGSASQRSSLPAVPSSAQQGSQPAQLPSHILAGSKPLEGKEASVASMEA